MIGGFILGGTVTNPARVVVRAIGPSLRQFGIDAALLDPDPAAREQRRRDRGFQRQLG